VLRAFFSQKIETEDKSYVFRILMAYVPFYMINVETEIRNGVHLIADTDAQNSGGSKL
jgi:hypothetical protein